MADAGVEAALGEGLSPVAHPLAFLLHVLGPLDQDHPGPLGEAPPPRRAVDLGGEEVDRLRESEVLLLDEAPQEGRGQHRPADLGGLEAAQGADDVELQDLEAGRVLVEVGAAEEDVLVLPGLEHGPPLQRPHAHGLAHPSHVVAEEPLGDGADQVEEADQVTLQGQPLLSLDEDRLGPKAAVEGVFQPVRLVNPRLERVQVEVAARLVGPLHQQRVVALVQGGRHHGHLLGPSPTPRSMPPR